MIKVSQKLLTISLFLIQSIFATDLFTLTPTSFKVGASTLYTFTCTFDYPSSSIDYINDIIRVTLNKAWAVPAATLSCTGTPPIGFEPNADCTNGTDGSQFFIIDMAPPTDGATTFTFSVTLTNPLKAIVDGTYPPVENKCAIYDTANSIARASITLTANPVFTTNDITTIEISAIESTTNGAVNGFTITLTNPSLVSDGSFLSLSLPKRNQNYVTASQMAATDSYWVTFADGQAIPATCTVTMTMGGNTYTLGAKTYVSTTTTDSLKIALPTQIDLNAVLVLTLGACIRNPIAKGLSENIFVYTLFSTLDVNAKYESSQLAITTNTEGALDSTAQKAYIIDKTTINLDGATYYFEIKVKNPIPKNGIIKILKPTAMTSDPISDPVISLIGTTTGLTAGTTATDGTVVITTDAEIAADTVLKFKIAGYTNPADTTAQVYQIVTTDSTSKNIDKGTVSINTIAITPTITTGVQGFGKVADYTFSLEVTGTVNYAQKLVISFDAAFTVPATPTCTYSTGFKTDTSPTCTADTTANTVTLDGFVDMAQSTYAFVIPGVTNPATASKTIDVQLWDGTNAKSSKYTFTFGSGYFRSADLTTQALTTTATATQINGGLTDLQFKFSSAFDIVSGSKIRVVLPNLYSPYTTTTFGMTGPISVIKDCTTPSTCTIPSGMTATFTQTDNSTTVSNSAVATAAPAGYLNGYLQTTLTFSAYIPASTVMTLDLTKHIIAPLLKGTKHQFIIEIVNLDGLVFASSTSTDANFQLTTTVAGALTYDSNTAIIQGNNTAPGTTSVDYHFVLTLKNPIPKTGTLKVTLPNTVPTSGVTYEDTETSGDTTISTSGFPQIVVTFNEVKAAGSTYTFKVIGTTIPSTKGSTFTFTSNADNKDIDTVDIIVNPIIATSSCIISATTKDKLADTSTYTIQYKPKDTNTANTGYLTIKFLNSKFAKLNTAPTCDVTAIQDSATACTPNLSTDLNLTVKIENLKNSYTYEFTIIDMINPLTVIAADTAIGTCKLFTVGNSEIDTIDLKTKTTTALWSAEAFANSADTSELAASRVSKKNGVLTTLTIVQKIPIKVLDIYQLRLALDASLTISTSVVSLKTKTTGAYATSTVTHVGQGTAAIVITFTAAPIDADSTYEITITNFKNPASFISHNIELTLETTDTTPVVLMTKTLTITNDEANAFTAASATIYSGNADSTVEFAFTTITALQSGDFIRVSSDQASEAYTSTALGLVTPSTGLDIATSQSGVPAQSIDLAVSANIAAGTVIKFSLSKLVLPTTSNTYKVSSMDSLKNIYDQSATLTAAANALTCTASTSPTSASAVSAVYSITVTPTKEISFDGFIVLTFDSSWGAALVSPSSCSAIAGFSATTPPCTKKQYGSQDVIVLESAEKSQAAYTFTLQGMKNPAATKTIECYYAATDSLNAIKTPDATTPASVTVTALGSITTETTSKVSIIPTTNGADSTMVITFKSSIDFVSGQKLKVVFPDALKPFAGKTDATTTHLSLLKGCTAFSTCAKITLAISTMPTNLVLKELTGNAPTTSIDFQIDSTTVADEQALTFSPVFGSTVTAGTALELTLTSSIINPPTSEYPYQLKISQLDSSNNPLAESTPSDANLQFQTTDGAAITMTTASTKVITVTTPGQVGTYNFKFDLALPLAVDSYIEIAVTPTTTFSAAPGGVTPTVDFDVDANSTASLFKIKNKVYKASMAALEFQITGLTNPTTSGATFTVTVKDHLDKVIGATTSAFTMNPSNAAAECKITAVGTLNHIGEKTTFTISYKSTKALDAAGGKVVVKLLASKFPFANPLDSATTVASTFTATNGFDTTLTTSSALDTPGDYEITLNGAKNEFQFDFVLSNVVNPTAVVTDITVALGSCSLKPPSGSAIDTVDLFPSATTLWVATQTVPALTVTLDNPVKKNGADTGLTFTLTTTADILTNYVIKISVPNTRNKIYGATKQTFIKGCSGHTSCVLSGITKPSLDSIASADITFSTTYTLNSDESYGEIKVTYTGTAPITSGSHVLTFSDGFVNPPSFEPTDPFIIEIYDDQLSKLFTTSSATVKPTITTSTASDIDSTGSSISIDSATKQPGVTSAFYEVTLKLGDGIPASGKVEITFPTTIDASTQTASDFVITQPTSGLTLSSPVITGLNPGPGGVASFILDQAVAGASTIKFKINNVKNPTTKGSNSFTIKTYDATSTPKQISVGTYSVDPMNTVNSCKITATTKTTTSEALSKFTITYTALDTNSDATGKLKVQLNNTFFTSEPTSITCPTGLSSTSCSITSETGYYEITSSNVLSKFDFTFEIDGLTNPATVPSTTSDLGNCIIAPATGSAVDTTPLKADTSTLWTAAPTAAALTVVMNNPEKKNGADTGLTFTLTTTADILMGYIIKISVPNTRNKIYGATKQTFIKGCSGHTSCVLSGITKPTLDSIPPTDITFSTTYTLNSDESYGEIKVTYTGTAPITSGQHVLTFSDGFVNPPSFEPTDPFIVEIYDDQSSKLFTTSLATVKPTITTSIASDIDSTGSSITIDSATKQPGVTSAFYEVTLKLGDAIPASGKVEITFPSSIDASTQTASDFVITQPTTGLSLSSPVITGLNPGPGGVASFILDQPVAGASTIKFKINNVKNPTTKGSNSFIIKTYDATSTPKQIAVGTYSVDPMNTVNSCKITATTLTTTSEALSKFTITYKALDTNSDTTGELKVQLNNTFFTSEPTSITCPTGLSSTSCTITSQTGYYEITSSNVLNKYEFTFEIDGLTNPATVPSTTSDLGTCIIKPATGSAVDTTPLTASTANLWTTAGLPTLSTSSFTKNEFAPVVKNNAAATYKLEFKLPIDFATGSNIVITLPDRYALFTGRPSSPATPYTDGTSTVMKYTDSQNTQQTVTVTPTVSVDKLTITYACVLPNSFASIPADTVITFDIGSFKTAPTTQGGKKLKFKVTDTANTPLITEYELDIAATTQAADAFSTSAGVIFDVYGSASTNTTGVVDFVLNNMNPLPTGGKMVITCQGTATVDTTALEMVLPATGVSIDTSSSTSTLVVLIFAAYLDPTTTPLNLRIKGFTKPTTTSPFTYKIETFNPVAGTDYKIDEGTVDAKLSIASCTLSQSVTTAGTAADYTFTVSALPKIIFDGAVLLTFNSEWTSLLPTTPTCTKTQGFATSSAACSFITAEVLLIPGAEKSTTNTDYIFTVTGITNPADTSPISCSFGDSTLITKSGSVDAGLERITATGTNLITSSSAVNGKDAQWTLNFKSTIDFATDNQIELEFVDNWNKPYAAAAQGSAPLMSAIKGCTTAQIASCDVTAFATTTFADTANSASSLVVSYVPQAGANGGSIKITPTIGAAITAGTTITIAFPTGKIVNPPTSEFKYILKVKQLSSTGSVLASSDDADTKFQYQTTTGADLSVSASPLAPAPDTDITLTLTLTTPLPFCKGGCIIEVAATSPTQFQSPTTVAITNPFAVEGTSTASKLSFMSTVYFAEFFIQQIVLSPFKSPNVKGNNYVVTLKDHLGKVIAFSSTITINPVRTTTQASCKIVSIDATSGNNEVGKVTSYNIEYLPKDTVSTSGKVVVKLHKDVFTVTSITVGTTLPSTPAPIGFSATTAPAVSGALDSQNDYYVISITEAQNAFKYKFTLTDIKNPATVLTAATTTLGACQVQDTSGTPVETTELHTDNVALWVAASPPADEITVTMETTPNTTTTNGADIGLKFTFTTLANIENNYIIKIGLPNRLHNYPSSQGSFIKDCATIASCDVTGIDSVILTPPGGANAITLTTPTYTYDSVTKIGWLSILYTGTTITPVADLVLELANGFVNPPSKTKSLGFILNIYDASSNPVLSQTSVKSSNPNDLSITNTLAASFDTSSFSYDGSGATDLLPGSISTIFVVTIKTKNPIPSNGKLRLTIPNTYQTPSSTIIFNPDNTGDYQGTLVPNLSALGATGGDVVLALNTPVNAGQTIKFKIVQMTNSISKGNNIIVIVSQDSADKSIDTFTSTSLDPIRTDSTCTITAVTPDTKYGATGVTFAITYLAKETNADQAGKLVISLKNTIPAVTSATVTATNTEFATATGVTPTTSGTNMVITVPNIKNLYKYVFQISLLKNPLLSIPATETLGTCEIKTSNGGAVDTIDLTKGSSFSGWTKATIASVTPTVDNNYFGAMTKLTLAFTLPLDLLNDHKLELVFDSRTSTNNGAPEELYLPQGSTILSISFVTSGNPSQSITGISASGLGTSKTIEISFSLAPGPSPQPVKGSTFTLIINGYKNADAIDAKTFTLKVKDSSNVLAESSSIALPTPQTVPQIATTMTSSSSKVGQFTDLAFTFTSASDIAIGSKFKVTLPNRFAKNSSLPAKSFLYGNALDTSYTLPQVITSKIQSTTSGSSPIDLTIAYSKDTSFGELTMTYSFTSDLTAGEYKLSITGSTATAGFINPPTQDPSEKFILDILSSSNVKLATSNGATTEPSITATEANTFASTTKVENLGTSKDPGQTSDKYQFTIVTSEPIPSDGKLKIQFPASIDPSNLVDANIALDSGSAVAIFYVDRSNLAHTAGRYLLIVFSDYIDGGSTIKVNIANLKNPQTKGNKYKITSIDSNAKEINAIEYEYNLGYSASTKSCQITEVTPTPGFSSATGSKFKILYKTSDTDSTTSGGSVQVTLKSQYFTILPQPATITCTIKDVTGTTCNIDKDPTNNNDLKITMTPIMGLYTIDFEVNNLVNPSVIPTIAGGSIGQCILMSGATTPAALDTTDLTIASDSLWTPALPPAGPLVTPVAQIYQTATSTNGAILFKIGITSAIPADGRLVITPPTSGVTFDTATLIATGFGQLSISTTQLIIPMSTIQAAQSTLSFIIKGIVFTGNSVTFGIKTQNGASQAVTIDEGTVVAQTVNIISCSVDANPQVALETATYSFTVTTNIAIQLNGKFNMHFGTQWSTFNFLQSPVCTQKIGISAVATKTCTIGTAVGQWSINGITEGQSFFIYTMNQIKNPSVSDQIDCFFDDTTNGLFTNTLAAKFSLEKITDGQISLTSSQTNGADSGMTIKFKSTADFNNGDSLSIILPDWNTAFKANGAATVKSVLKGCTDVTAPTCADTFKAALSTDTFNQASITSSTVQYLQDSSTPAGSLKLTPTLAAKIDKNTEIVISFVTGFINPPTSNTPYTIILNQLDTSGLVAQSQATDISFQYKTTTAATLTASVVATPNTPGATGSSYEFTVTDNLPLCQDCVIQINHPWTSGNFATDTTKFILTNVDATTIALKSVSYIASLDSAFKVTITGVTNPTTKGNNFYEVTLYDAKATAPNVIAQISAPVSYDPVKTSGTCILTEADTPTNQIGQINALYKIVYEPADTTTTTGKVIITLKASQFPLTGNFAKVSAVNGIKGFTSAALGSNALDGADYKIEITGAQNTFEYEFTLVNVVNPLAVTSSVSTALGSCSVFSGASIITTSTVDLFPASTTLWTPANAGLITGNGYIYKAGSPPSDDAVYFKIRITNAIPVDGSIVITYPQGVVTTNPPTLSTTEGFGSVSPTIDFIVVKMSSEQSAGSELILLVKGFNFAGSTLSGFDVKTKGIDGTTVIDQGTVVATTTVTQCSVSANPKTAGTSATYTFTITTTPALQVNGNFIFDFGNQWGASDVPSSPTCKKVTDSSTVSCLSPSNNKISITSAQVGVGSFSYTVDNVKNPTTAAQITCTFNSETTLGFSTTPAIATFSLEAIYSGVITPSTPVNGAEVGMTIKFKSTSDFNDGDFIVISLPDWNTAFKNNGSPTVKSVLKGCSDVTVTACADAFKAAQTITIPFNSAGITPSSNTIDYLYDSTLSPAGSLKIKPNLGGSKVNKDTEIVISFDTGFINPPTSNIPYSIKLGHYKNNVIIVSSDPTDTTFQYKTTTAATLTASVVATPNTPGATGSSYEFTLTDNLPLCQNCVIQIKHPWTTATFGTDATKFILTNVDATTIALKSVSYIASLDSAFKVTITGVTNPTTKGYNKYEVTIYDFVTSNPNVIAKTAAPVSYDPVQTPGTCTLTEVDTATNKIGQTNALYKIVYKPADTISTSTTGKVIITLDAAQFPLTGGNFEQVNAANGIKGFTSAALGSNTFDGANYKIEITGAQNSFEFEFTLANVVNPISVTSSAATALGSCSVFSGSSIIQASTINLLPISTTLWAPADPVQVTVVLTPTATENGANTDFTLAFTLANSIKTGDYFLLTFPNRFKEYPTEGAQAFILGCDMTTCTPPSVFAVKLSGQSHALSLDSVTYANSKGTLRMTYIGATLPSGVTKLESQGSGFVLPPTQTVSDPFSLEMLNTNNQKLITSNAFTVQSTNPNKFTDVLGIIDSQSNTAGISSNFYQIQVTTVNPIPASGKLKLVFPTTINSQNAAFQAAPGLTGSDFYLGTITKDATSQLSAVGGTAILTLSALVKTNQKIYFQITGLTNPMTVGNQFSLSSMEASNTEIDRAQNFVIDPVPTSSDPPNAASSCILSQATPNLIAGTASIWKFSYKLAQTNTNDGGKIKITLNKKYNWVKPTSTITCASTANNFDTASTCSATQATVSDDLVIEITNIKKFYTYTFDIVSMNNPLAMAAAVTDVLGTCQLENNAAAGTYLDTSTLLGVAGLFVKAPLPSGTASSADDTNGVSTTFSYIFITPLPVTLGTFFQLTFPSRMEFYSAADTNAEDSTFLSTDSVVSITYGTSNTVLAIKTTEGLNTNTLKVEPKDFTRIDANTQITISITKFINAPSVQPHSISSFAFIDAFGNKVAETATPISFTTKVGSFATTSSGVITANTNQAASNAVYQFNLKTTNPIPANGQITVTILPTSGSFTVANPTLSDFSPTTLTGNIDASNDKKYIITTSTFISSGATVSFKIAGFNNPTSDSGNLYEVYSYDSNNKAIDTIKLEINPKPSTSSCVLKSVSDPAVGAQSTYNIEFSTQTVSQANSVVKIILPSVVTLKDTNPITCQTTKGFTTQSQVCAVTAGTDGKLSIVVTGTSASSYEFFISVVGLVNPYSVQTEANSPFITEQGTCSLLELNGNEIQAPVNLVVNSIVFTPATSFSAEFAPTSFTNGEVTDLKIAFSTIAILVSNSYVKVQIPKRYSFFTEITSTESSINDYKTTGPALTASQALICKQSGQTDVTPTTEVSVIENEVAGFDTIKLKLTLASSIAAGFKCEVIFSKALRNPPAINTQLTAKFLLSDHLNNKVASQDVIFSTTTAETLTVTGAITGNDQKGQSGAIYEFTITSVSTISKNSEIRITIPAGIVVTPSMASDPKLQLTLPYTFGDLIVKTLSNLPASTAFKVAIIGFTNPTTTTGNNYKVAINFVSTVQSTHAIGTGSVDINPKSDIATCSLVSVSNLAVASKASYTFKYTVANMSPTAASIKVTLNKYIFPLIQTGDVLKCTAISTTSFGGTTSCSVTLDKAKTPVITISGALQGQKTFEFTVDGITNPSTYEKPDLTIAFGNCALYNAANSKVDSVDLKNTNVWKQASITKASFTSKSKINGETTDITLSFTVVPDLAPDSKVILLLPKRTSFFVGADLGQVKSFESSIAGCGPLYCNAKGKESDMVCTKQLAKTLTIKTILLASFGKTSPDYLDSLIITPQLKETLSAGYSCTVTITKGFINPPSSNQVQEFNLQFADKTNNVIASLASPIVYSSTVANKFSLSTGQIVENKYAGQSNAVYEIGLKLENSIPKTGTIKITIPSSVTLTNPTLVSKDISIKSLVKQELILIAGNYLIEGSTLILTISGFKNPNTYSGNNFVIASFDHKGNAIDTATIDISPKIPVLTVTNFGSVKNAKTTIEFTCEIPVTPSISTISFTVPTGYTLANSCTATGGFATATTTCSKSDKSYIFGKGASTTSKPAGTPFTVQFTGLTVPASNPKAFTLSILENGKIVCTGTYTPSK